jgi:hypothetical protein
MNNRAIDLQEIDFSQPDGTFEYEGEIFDIKQYLDKYFFKYRFHESRNFIYAFRDSGSAKYICEEGQLPENFALWGGYLLLFDSIQRCVQYEGIIFCFSFGNYSCGELLVGDVIYFSSKYGYWMSFDRETVEERSYEDFLERPNEFFINEAKKAYEADRLQPISLRAIDFSQPDGEVVIRGQVYEVKEYLNKYFLRNKLQTGYDFIYSLEELRFLIKEDSFSKDPLKIDLPDLIGLQRCIDYENTIFCFNWDSSNEYCSFKSKYWIPFDWKTLEERYSSDFRENYDERLNDLLEQPYNFFLEQAKNIHHDGHLEINIEEMHPLLKASYKFREPEPLAFIKGSQEELERLTKLAATALAELQPLFEEYNTLQVWYTSFDMLIHISCGTDFLSKELKRVFNLIFEYNYFTGFGHKPRYGGPGFDGYEMIPLWIGVEIQAPSATERQQALIELRSWLEGKMSPAEIQSYYEGDYAIAPPNPIEVAEKMGYSRARDDLHHLVSVIDNFLPTNSFSTS